MFPRFHYLESILAQMKLYLFQSYGHDIDLQMSETERTRAADEMETELHTDEDESPSSHTGDGGHDDEVQSTKRTGELITEPGNKRMKSPFGAAKVWKNPHKRQLNTLNTTVHANAYLSARSHSPPSTTCALPSTGGWEL